MASAFFGSSTPVQSQVTEADVGVHVTFGTFAEPGVPAGQLVSAYEVACSKQQAAGLGQLIQATSKCSKAADGRLSLAGVAALPAAVVTYKPILAKTVAPLPLSRELQDSLRSGSTGHFQAGFLSMDQGRSLVPLAATESTAYAVPLMGVWAAGVDSVRHPLVAAACIKFLCSKALADKALELDKSFLVLLYPQGKASQPVCFECHISLSDNSIPLKAMTFTLTGDAAQAVCELAPAPEVQLPGCPVSVGRRLGAAGLGSAGASPASERSSWQPGPKISPAGGVLSHQPSSWTGGHGEAQPSVEAGTRPGPTAGLSAAGQLMTSSITEQQSGTGRVAADLVQPALPAAMSEKLDAEAAEAGDCMWADSAVAAELGAASATAIKPSKGNKADIDSRGSKDRTNSEQTEGACLEECSSVPSFAGWSTNAPEAGVSREVAVLQQEVLMLRQQPAFAAAASQQGSPGAVSVVAAGPSGGHEGSPCSSNSLIPAFREGVDSQAMLGECFTPGVVPMGQQPPGLVPAAKMPPQVHAAAQQAGSASAAADAQVPGSATLARQDAEGICEGPGAREWQANVESCQPARHGGDALPDSQAQSEPSRVVSAEAEIDRLIADAERAVSVLSCYSDLSCSGGNREAPGVAAMPAHDAGLASRSTAAPPRPCSPGHSADSCPSPAPAAGPAREDHKPLRFAPAASSLSSQGTGISVAGVVRVKVPSFWDCVGSDAESEDDDEVERLEQKYGLRGRRK
ncbi:hypothetical protein N2152v2_005640 [Parachlorella kessleri]